MSCHVLHVKVRIITGVETVKVGKVPELVYEIISQPSLACTLFFLPSFLAATSSCKGHALEMAISVNMK